MGNNCKEGIPFATATGLTAIDLAAAGFTGPIDLLDDPRRFDTQKLIGGLGESWLIESTYFKPYSCCRWIHAPVDAVVKLQAEHAIAARDITSIDIHSFPATLALNNECAPSTLESAQYSTPFCVALAALCGPEALLPLEAAALGDAEAIALAGRIRLHLDPGFEALFPDAVPARVVVTTAGGSVSETVMAPKGEPSNPMSWSELTDKFRTVASRYLSAPATLLLEQAIAALEAGDLQPLLAALAQPMMASPARALA
jgi:2-methylcitrate dehydratase PrpD